MIVGIHHCSIGVTDLERSMSFYCDDLGFKLIWRGDGGWEGMAAAIGRPELKWRVAWLRHGETVVELIEPSPRDDTQSSSWPGGIGFNHIGLRVTDIENLYADLLGKGLKFHVPLFKSPAGVTGAFAKDPDGNVIELFHDPGNLETPE